MSTARRLMEMGEMKGFEKGIEKGIEQGIEQGLEKGKIIESQNILTKFIKTKFDTDIDDTDIETIKSCNELKKLKDALEELLSSENKDIILGKLK